MTASDNDRRNAMLAAILAAAAGVLLFGHMFGFDLPLASAAFWSMPKNDMAAMTTGYEALLREPWSLSGLALTDRLTGKPLSVVFTDSIPWLSLALKASGLGDRFNPLGVFLLIAYALQGASMVLLLRAMGVRGFAPLLAGGLLALMTPAWVVRQFGHIALTGHFLLILMLALTVLVIRHGLTRARVAGFCALGALATGVHAYHLVPFAFCLGAALVSTLLQRGPRALPAVLAAGLACVIAVGASALLLGYTVGRGASGGADALGVYAMNLLGPFDPQGSGLFGQAWNGTWFARSYETTGGQAFEGFNYLGAGAVVAVALAGVLLLTGRGRRERRSGAARWLDFAPLVLAAVALTVIAIGPTVYAHTWLVAQFPKPTGRLAEIAGFFRAHGRFFWTAGYLMVAASVCLLHRRLPARAFAAVAALIVGLQAFDTVPVRQGVRDTFDEAADSVWPQAMARDPALRGRPWVFNPTYFCLGDVSDMTALTQLALIAVRGEGTLNSVATARASDDECGYPAELLHDAAPGDRRVTVVLNGGVTDGGRLDAYRNRTDCRRFDRGVICGRELDGTGLAPVRGDDLRGRQPVAEVRFDRDGRQALLREGWSRLDPGAKGVWSDGRRAVVDLPAPASCKAGDFVNVDLILFGYSDMPAAPQRVIVRMADRVIGELSVAPGVFEPYRVRAPTDLLTPGQPLRLVFDIPGAHALAQDPRALGVAIQSAKVSY